MKTVHNIETGEITELPLTTEEIASQEVSIAKFEELKTEAEAKAAAKQAVLDRLGLTAEEAALLVK